MSIYHIECRTEEILLLNLGLTREKIKHHSGNGSVCKAMEDGKNLFGLIDEDPNRSEYQHDYYDRLYKKPESDEFGIRYSIDKKRKNKLVFIKPSFEPWIIRAAYDSGLKMADFNLSNDPNSLHREIIFKTSDLQKLIHKLLRIKNPAIIRLKELVFNK